jgi:rubrerythrin
MSGGSLQAKATYEKGRKSLSRGDMRGALDCFLLARKLNKGHPTYMLAAAAAHLRLGESAAAAALFERASTLVLSAKQASMLRDGLAAPATTAPRAFSASRGRSAVAAAQVPVQPIGRDATFRLSRNRDLALRTAQDLPLRADDSSRRLRPGSAPAPSVGVAPERRREALAVLADAAREARLRAAAATQPAAPAAAAARAAADEAAGARRHALGELKRAASRARATAPQASEPAGGESMRFGTSHPASGSQRADALRALEEDAARARRMSLARDQSHARAWREADRPGVLAPNQARWRCPVCQLLMPRAVGSCTSCLHTRHGHVAAGVVNGRTLVWRKSTTGMAYKQSVARGRM